MPVEHLRVDLWYCSGCEFACSEKMCLRSQQNRPCAHSLRSRLSTLWTRILISRTTVVAGASIQPSLSPGFDRKFFGFLMIFVARAVQEHSRVTKRYEACDKIGPELGGVNMLKID